VLKNRGRRKLQDMAVEKTEEFGKFVVSGAKRNNHDSHYPVRVDFGLVGSFHETDRQS
jgi:hypothetical protein